MATTNNVMLSEHFSLKEFLHSPKAEAAGIENIAPHDVIKTGYKTALCMEKVRAVLKAPIITTSWYRCLDLNRLLKSADTSQHIQGEAVDFICPKFGTPKDICKFLVQNQSLIQFDQLILEHTWVHISFAIRSGKPRHQVLSLLASGGYSSGLTDAKGKPYN